MVYCSPAELEDGEIVQSEPAASEARAAEHSSSSDHMYTRNELIDLGEVKPSERMSMHWCVVYGRQLKAHLHMFAHYI